MKRFLSAILFTLTVFGYVFGQSYPWPISPMNQQHRVSATFDECRGDRDHFHNGTDIPLAPGGNTLCVESGQVTSIYPNGADAYIRVGRFAYIHVDADPSLEVGDQVALGELVGHTNSQAHVHLKDGGGASGEPVLNSLRPNAITPFEDPYGQRVYSIDFYLDGPGTQFTNNQVFGPVDIVVRAGDTTDTQASIDMNNGVYKIGYRVFDSDQTTPVTDMQMSYVFDHLYSSSIINRVYALGSNTSTYKYIVTNTETRDKYWDTSSLAPGDYSVAIFTFDTKNNSDTTFFPVTVMEQDTSPPTPPHLTFVGERNDSLVIDWQPNTEPDLAGYRLYFSYDRTDWTLSKDESELGPETTHYAIPGYPNDIDIYFYLTAVDNAPLPNASQPSDKYGLRLSSDYSVLLVDGFNRTTGIWPHQSHSFAAQYGHILDSLGVGFHTASSKAIDSGYVSPDAYPSVIWMEGDNEQTFSSSEREQLRQYLEGGGQLMASGAFISKDLGLSSDTGAQSFLHNYLRANFGEIIRQPYSFAGVASTLFSGVTGTIDTTDFPLDSLSTIVPANDATASLQLSSGETIGNQYEGTFGTGTISGKVVVSSIPLFVIANGAIEAQILQAVLGYFGLIPTEIVQSDHGNLPEQYDVSAAYPNPFNSTTSFRVSVTQPVRLRYAVFDILGRKVFSQEKPIASAGVYDIHWDASSFASGVYLLEVRLINRENHSIVHTFRDKMLLLK